MLGQFDIEDVLRHFYVRSYKLTNGSEQVYFCPRCDRNSDHGHLYVNREKNVCYCVVCGFSGNPVTVAAQLLGTDNKEAYAYLVQEFNARHYCRVKPILTEQQRKEDIVPYDIDTLNDVYNEFLDMLKLSTKDTLKLKQRGLDEKFIAARKYKSVPEDAEKIGKIIKELQKNYDIRRIPGFYISENSTVRMVAPRGFFIPVRNREGKIASLLIRTEIKDAKYIFFSKSTFGGAKAWNIVHYTTPLEPGIEELFVTEGILKADVAYYLSGGKPFISVNGVGMWKHIADEIEYLKPRKVYICFDMDMYENKNVLESVKNLYERIKTKTKAEVLKWDRRYKGIDDYLLARRLATVKVQAGKQ